MISEYIFCKKWKEVDKSIFQINNKNDGKGNKYNEKKI
jgi:hypothetical protein